MKYLSFVFFLFFFLVGQLIDYGDARPIADFQRIYLPAEVTGPESLGFDCNATGPYVGVSDGRILKWEVSKDGWKEFATPSPYRNRKLCDGNKDPNLEIICGRPLGLKFNPKTCELYVADAYFGLLVVGPNGGAAKRIAFSAEGIPFKLTNGLDIDSNTGVVYFTDSSTVFQRRDVDFLVNTTSDKSGRLLKYDPNTKKIDVLYKDLTFPNGVALSADSSFVLVAESNKRRILKFNLETGGEKIHKKVFAELDNIPDNIQRNKKGEFWISIGVKYSVDGKLLKSLKRNGNDNGGDNFTISEINEFEDKLYIGSVTNSFVAILDVV